MPFCLLSPHQAKGKETTVATAVLSLLLLMRNSVCDERAARVRWKSTTHGILKRTVLLLLFYFFTFEFTICNVKLRNRQLCVAILAQLAF